MTATEAPVRYDTGWVRSEPYGQFIAGRRAAEGKTRHLVDPSTGQRFAQWVEAAEGDVERAVAVARTSFDNGPWRRMIPPRRAEVLERAAALIKERAVELATLDSLCTGKAISGAIVYDAFEASNAFVSAAAAIRELTGDARMAGYPPELLPGGGPAVLNLRLSEPAGVVAELLPWNGPVFTGSERIAAALAAGCSVVAKPSEESPCSLLEVAEILQEAGLPDGVLNVVLGRGETVGEQLVRDPRVDLVSLTGSVETGARLAKIAGKQLKRVNLELGGKAPVIVFADADLDQAVMWSMLGAFVNMGEVCVAGSRLLVEASVYDEVVAGVAGAASGLPIGDALDPSTFIGPLVNERHADRVRGFIDRALADGAATRVGGGTVPAGLNPAFVAPVVLGDARPGSEIEQCEVFGPVLAAQRFETEEQALALANSTQYGLSASVFTGSIDRALRVAEGLQAGDVDVNCHFIPNIHAGRGTPRRKSGTSVLGIQAYVTPKAINVNLNRSSRGEDPSPAAPPSPAEPAAASTTNGAPSSTAETTAAAVPTGSGPTGSSGSSRPDVPTVAVHEPPPPPPSVSHNGTATAVSATGGGKLRRFRRLIAADGRGLFVAVDHAAYMGGGPPPEVVARIAAGGPDAVLSTWHLARANAGALSGCGLVLRVDGGVSELGAPAPDDASSLLHTVDEALRIGADALVLLVFPGAHDEHHSLHRLARLASECEAVGLPVMAEAIPGGWAREVPWTVEHVARACRIAVELGADIVKTVCPGPTEEFAEVVAACPAPVVALGGPKMANDDDVVALASGVVAAGAAGVAIGRNVWGAADPTALVRRLHTAVHQTPRV